MEHDIPIPLDGDIQHHAVIQGIVSGCQLSQFIQFCGFQLRYEAHCSDIDPQNRDSPAGRRLGHVQNRSVSTEADHHVRVGQLPVQPGKPQIPGQFKTPVHLKGQTEPGLHAALLQDAQSLPNRVKIFIPIWIRGQNDTLHSYQCSLISTHSCPVSDALFLPHLRYSVPFLPHHPDSDAPETRYCPQVPSPGRRSNP